MKDKYFFDTNVLVYMQDASAPVKQQKVRSLLSTHLSNGSVASFAKCTVLYSEDMNDGQVVNGVKIQNPFV